MIFGMYEWQYHQILKTITSSKKDRSIPPLEKPNGETVTDNRQKATLLNDYFAAHSRLDISLNQTPTPIQSRHDVMPLMEITVTERETLSILNSLDTHKSCGIDKLPNKI